MCSSREFQISVAATEKARLPTVDSLTGGTTSRLVPAERSAARRPGTSAVEVNGLHPVCHVWHRLLLIYRPREMEGWVDLVGWQCNWTGDVSLLSTTLSATCPFQMMVLHLPTTSENSLMLCGPMSRPCRQIKQQIIIYYTLWPRWRYEAPEQPNIPFLGTRLQHTCSQVIAPSLYKFMQSLVLK